MAVMKVLPTALLLAAAPALAPAQELKLPPEPATQRIVVEDHGARIEELRVRGQTQRIVVKPRRAAEYEVVPANAGRDPSQNRANGQPGAGGQRVWNLLKF
jgi:hypothetical protein